MNLTAQILGLVASICIITSVQQKKKQEILLFLLLGESLFALNFLFLNAYTGFMVSAIAAMNTGISYFFQHNNKSIPKIIVILIVITALLSGFLFYKEFYDLFPVICSLMGASILIIKQEKNIRKLTMLSAMLWFIYDFHVGAYTGILSDIFYFCSSFIAMIRYDFQGTLIPLIKKNNT